MNRFKLVFLNIAYLLVCLVYSIIWVSKFPINLFMKAHIWVIFTVVLTKRQLAIMIDAARAEKA